MNMLDDLYQEVLLEHKRASAQLRAPAMRPSLRRGA